MSIWRGRPASENISGAPAAGLTVFPGKATLPPRQEGRCREQRCSEAFPMFRGQPPRINHLTTLGAERTAIGPAMFDALSIMMPSARSARPVPERPLDGLGIASFFICHGQ
jgi:hypothetical protein